MPERAQKIHWLRGNKAERTPRRLIFLDTEGRIVEQLPREVQELRCWVAKVVVRGERPGQITDCTHHEGFERQEIADLIRRTVKSEGSWRLFTHNLNYDLGLTRLPLALVEQGWALGRHNLASEQPWAHLSRGSRSLWLCDSWSWLPTSVEKLGEALGISKPRLPSELDSDETWLSRCRADTEILASAVCELMDEWDRRQLGWWSITGPASGWNSMLHFPFRGLKARPEPLAHHSENPRAPAGRERVLIVPDPKARAFERQALYSGRRDVWRVGKLGPGPWCELDLRQAHLSICAHHPLPFRRWKPFDSLGLDDWRLTNPQAGLLAQVLVRTQVPRYPLRVKGAVLHPVGEFQTVLAGPEILDARQRGELISIGPGYGYHLGHRMRDWAQWALGVVNSEDQDLSPMLRIAVRSWGRSVPGRWGMTHSRQIKSGPSHVDGWSLEHVTVGSPPRRGFVFHLAGTWQESLSDEEADDSFPAVLAYIQSWCRLALNKILDAINTADLVSCNTEGAWVHERALAELAAWAWEGEPGQEPRETRQPNALAELSRYVAPLEVRIKQTARSLKVLSPQHHQTDQARLYSGIPRAAEETRPDTFTFWTWPKLRGQIERGDPRGYVRERRTVSLANLPVSRWSFQDGHCEPVEARWGPEIGNVIQGPCPELERRHGPLRASQHPALRRVLAQAR